MKHDTQHIKKKLLPLIKSAWGNLDSDTIREYVDKNLILGDDAIDRIRGFMKSNRRKIEKWVKYFCHEEEAPDELCLVDRLEWNTDEYKCVRVKQPRLIDFRFVDPDEYYEYLTFSEEHRYYDRQCDTFTRHGAMWAFHQIYFDVERTRGFFSTLTGIIQFQKIGARKYKMLFNGIPDGIFRSPYYVEFYGDGTVTYLSVDTYYPIGNTCMGGVCYKSRYEIQRTLSADYWLGMFAAMLPQIQELLDRMETVYDRDYAEEDSGFLNRVKFFFMHADDSVDSYTNADGDSVY